MVSGLLKSAEVQSGTKVPKLSEDSIRRLRAMEDWYNGPMDETIIANRYKDWLYLQTRALEVAKGSIVEKSIESRKDNHAAGPVQSLATRLPSKNTNSDKDVTPNYFSNSPTPTVPDIPLGNQGDNGGGVSSDEEKD